MVEEGDTVMGKLIGRVPQQDGSPRRLTLIEPFAMRDGSSRERRARVARLHEDGVR